MPKPRTNAGWMVVTLIASLLVVAVVFLPLYTTRAALSGIHAESPSGTLPK